MFKNRTVLIVFAIKGKRILIRKNCCYIFFISRLCLRIGQCLLFCYKGQKILIIAEKLLLYLLNFYIMLKIMSGYHTSVCSHYSDLFK